MRWFLGLLFLLNGLLVSCLPGEIIGFPEGQLGELEYRSEINDMISEFLRERDTLISISSAQPGVQPDPQALERLYLLVNENRSELRLFEPPESYQKVHSDFENWLSQLFILVNRFRELYLAKEKGGVGPTASLLQNSQRDYQSALQQLNQSLIFELNTQTLPGENLALVTLFAGVSH